MQLQPGAGAVGGGRRAEHDLVAATRASTVQVDTTIDASGQHQARSSAASVHAANTRSGAAAKVWVSSTVWSVVPARPRRAGPPPGQHGPPGPIQPIGSPTRTTPGSRTPA